MLNLSTRAQTTVNSNYGLNALERMTIDHESREREMKLRLDRYAHSLCLLIDHMPDEILLKLLAQHNEFLDMFLEHQTNDKKVGRAWVEIVGHEPIGHPHLTVHQVIRHPAKEV